MFFIVPCKVFPYTSELVEIMPTKLTAKTNLLWKKPKPLSARVCGAFPRTEPYNDR
jgi:hypothetical protein